MQKAHKGNLSQTDIEAADFSKSMQNPGSHNGHELELMLRGLKPMALFIAEDVVPPEAVGDAEFSPYVEQGRIIKLVYRNDELKFERRCYCLPTEEWRGKLSNFLFRLSCEGDLTSALTPEDRTRIEGFLLGYPKESTDWHIQDLKEHFVRD